MEKSIEHIWKEGFSNSSLLLTPNIEDIESLESIYFVDKFKKMYKTNIIGLAATGIIVLFAFILGGVPFIGLFLFGMFAGLAILGQRELHRLQEIVLGDNSYEFLKAFDAWLKNLLAKFSHVYRYWIPVFFMGFMLGILRTNLFVPFWGDTLMGKMLNSPNAWIGGGLVVFWVSCILLVAILLSFFSHFIFKREMNSIYGGILGKLEQLLKDMEELR